MIVYLISFVADCSAFLCFGLCLHLEAGSLCVVESVLVGIVTALFLVHGVASS